MRTKLLLLFVLLVFEQSYSIDFFYNAKNSLNEVTVVAPVTPSLPDLTVCDDNNDGFSVFDLTFQTTSILAAQSGSSSNYTVTYHESFTDASLGSSPLNASSYYNFNPYSQTIYYRIVDTTTSEDAVGTFTIIVNNIPYFSNLQTVSVCDTDSNPYNGSTLINLDLQTPIVLAQQALPASSYSVTYYTSMSNAEAGTAPILNSSAFLATNGQTIWVRCENLSSGCYYVGSFGVSVQQFPEPTITTNTGGNTACVDWNETVVNNNLILDSNISNTGYTFSWYKNAMLITGANSSTLAITNMIENYTEYSVIATSTSFLGCQSNITNFTVVRSGTASPINGTGYVVTNLSGVQSISVEVAGFGIYQFQLDNNLPQDNGYFEDVSIGTHTINVIDYGGCGVFTLTIEITESLVPAPDGLNSQSFTEGQTLADIVVSGENIQWYSSANGTTPLPLNTPLVNGVTYYATQTVNGTESAARLAVTVTVALGVSENQLLNVLLSPNPAKHTFQLQSRDVLKSVELYNLLGQKVLEQHSNASQLSVDISELHSGNYILKVFTDNGQKTLRLIKE